MWIPDYLGVIESDLSAIHRVDDMSSLTSRRFIGLVTRLMYYKNSALRQLLEIEESESEQTVNAPQNFETPTTQTPSENSKIHQLGPLVQKKKPDKVYDDIRLNREAFELGFIEAGTG